MQATVRTGPAQLGLRTILLGEVPPNLGETGGGPRPDLLEMTITNFPQPYESSRKKLIQLRGRARTPRAIKSTVHCDPGGGDTGLGTHNSSVHLYRAGHAKHTRRRLGRELTNADDGDGVNNGPSASGDQKGQAAVQRYYFSGSNSSATASCSGTSGKKLSRWQ